MSAIIVIQCCQRKPLRIPSPSIITSKSPNAKASSRRSSERSQRSFWKLRGSTALSFPFLVGWTSPIPIKRASCKHLSNPRLTLDKYLLLKILSYLRLSELVVTYQVCSYFLSCYRSLWNDKTFFCQLETDKLTSKELGKLIEKSSKLDHIRQLKHIYQGKNINCCREKYTLDYKELRSKSAKVHSIAEACCRSSLLLLRMRGPDRLSS